MTHWFGASWGAPLCRMCPQVPTPVGELCIQCERPIVDGDQGVLLPYVGAHHALYVPYHLDCFLDTILPHARRDGA